MVLGIDPIPVTILKDRDSTLAANMSKFGSEPSVEQQAAAVVHDAESGHAVATDGSGEVDR